MGNADSFFNSIYFKNSRLSSESGNSYDSGYSGRDSSASNIMACNPDLQAAVPQIMQLLDQVRHKSISLIKNPNII